MNITVTASLDTGKHYAKICDSNILRDLKMTPRTAQVSRIKEMTHRLFLKRNRAITTGVLCLRKFRSFKCKPKSLTILASNLIATEEDRYRNTSLRIRINVTALNKMCLCEKKINEMRSLVIYHQLP